LLSLLTTFNGAEEEVVVVCNVVDGDVDVGDVMGGEEGEEEGEEGDTGFIHLQLIQTNNCEYVDNSRNPSNITNNNNNITEKNRKKERNIQYLKEEGTTNRETKQ
jgi:hypothetical protein